MPITFKSELSDLMILKTLLAKSWNFRMGQSLEQEGKGWNVLAE
jgi:hypothetical protein